MNARSKRQQLVTLLLSLAITVVLASSIYLAVTSLPYLAASPTSDNTFGTLNACMLEAAHERLGFSVSKDAHRVTAWSASQTVECHQKDTLAMAAELPLKSVTAGAYSGDGTLWLATSGPEAGLYSMTPTPRRLGALEAQALVGTDIGVVALEPTGRLSALDATGAVSGTYALQSARGASVSVSGDGQRVAVTLGERLIVLDAHSLVPVFDQLPCPLEQVWWLKGRRSLLINCGPKASWSLVLNVDSGQQEAAPHPGQTPSVLSGPDGPYVEPCDMLPCTARPPLP